VPGDSSFRCIPDTRVRLRACIRGANAASVAVFMSRFRVTALVDIECVAILHPDGSEAVLDGAVPEPITLRRGETRTDIALIRRVRETAGSSSLDVIPHPSQPGQLIWPGGLLQLECLD
jgi:hypothetical protein